MKSITTIKLSLFLLALSSFILMSCEDTSSAPAPFVAAAEPPPPPEPVDPLVGIVQRYNNLKDPVTMTVPMDVYSAATQYDRIKELLEPYKERPEADTMLSNIAKINDKTRLRNAYCKRMKDALWEHDIDVSCSKTKITLTGYVFVRNANVKSYADLMADPCRYFGFKKMAFKYEGAQEWTEYTLN